LPKRKGSRERNKPLVNQHNENLTPKPMGHRADLWNVETRITLLREELTKQLLLKDRKKNYGVSPKYLVRLRQSFC
jgi:hypothetical protein